MTNQKQEVALWNGRECKILTFATGKAYFYKKFKARESRLVTSMVYNSISSTPEELATGKVTLSIGTILANFEGLINAFCAKVEDVDGNEIAEKIEFFDNLEMKEGDQVQQVLLKGVTDVLQPSTALETVGGKAKKA